MRNSSSKSRLPTVRKNLDALKKKRDDARIIGLLESVERAARGGDNLMPVIIEAVRGSCTLGEISAAMERVFGRYSPGMKTA